MLGVQCSYPKGPCTQLLGTWVLGIGITLVLVLEDMILRYLDP